MNDTNVIQCSNPKLKFHLEIVLIGCLMVNISIIFCFTLSLYSLRLHMIEEFNVTHNSDHMGLADFVRITENPDYVYVYFFSATKLLIYP